ncbi:MAG: DoxX family protein [Bacteroidota bacterium]
MFSAIMLFSAGNYLLRYEAFIGIFGQLGYPEHLILPLAIAKLLGLVAIWTRRSKSLTEWAYAGFFFDTFLAALAHISAGDGAYPFALIAMTLMFISYFTGKRVRK